MREQRHLQRGDGVSIGELYDAERCPDVGRSHSGVSQCNCRRHEPVQSLCWAAEDEYIFVAAMWRGIKLCNLIHISKFLMI